MRDSILSLAVLIDLSLNLNRSSTEKITNLSAKKKIFKYFYQLSFGIYQIW